jgi:hypothetical protein
MRLNKDQLPKCLSQFNSAVYEAENCNYPFVGEPPVVKELSEVIDTIPWNANFHAEVFDLSTPEERVEYEKLMNYLSSPNTRGKVVFIDRRWTESVNNYKIYVEYLCPFYKGGTKNNE